MVLHRIQFSVPVFYQEFKRDQQVNRCVFHFKGLTVRIILESNIRGSCIGLCESIVLVCTKTETAIIALDRNRNHMKGNISRVPEQKVIL